jgi:hypothetical protein
MKKALFLVAVATLFLFSCQKENTRTEQKGITLKASIEALSNDVKATMNDQLQLVWATNDRIGIYVDDWTGHNQPFHLDPADNGKTSGNFIYDNDGGVFTNTSASFAFFPWQGYNSTDNNRFGDIMYFKMREGYDNYVSGQMLTPLVAPMSHNGTDYNTIEFKHAAAAIKVVVSNFPAGAHSMGISVEGKQVRGDYEIAVADAGTAAMTPSTSNTSLNDVWLNVEPTSAERAFTFIFPVPELTAPKITFSIYDKNDVLVWTKTPKAQSNISRGKVLAMPALSITPYEKFNSISEAWTVVGTCNGSSWDVDFPMITDGNHCIAKGLVFGDGGAFKVRAWKDWGQAHPASNVSVPSAGTYDIILNLSNFDDVVAVPTGECPYPAASGVGKAENLKDPTTLTGSYGDYFE